METRNSSNIIKKLVKILVVLIGFLIIIFLAFRYIAPFGKVVYYRFTSKLPGSEETTIFTQEKNSVLKIPAQIITTAKSKIQVNLLSPNIESIKASLKFKPTVNEIILGLKGKEIDNFLYQPIYRGLLLDLNWVKKEEGEFALWQKQEKYKSINEFINNLPYNEKVVFYFVDQDKLIALQEQQTKEKIKTVLDTPLRGSHSLSIRVNNKPLIIKVTKQDMNAYIGEDKLKINVVKEGKTITEKIIKDDGITDTSRLKMTPQEETLTLEDIEQGIYQVNLNFESEGFDSLITKIEINQQKIVFKNTVSPLGDKPTILWTNIPKINIATSHDTSLQTVKLNDEYNLKIEVKNKQYLFDLAALTGNKTPGKLYKLESSKNDLFFKGDGYFSLSESSFFLPEIIKTIDLSTLNNLEDIDYILTSYTPPKKDGDWLSTELIFDPKKIKIEGDKIYFSLEVPQISKYGGQLEIDYLEIEVKYKGILEKRSSPNPATTAPLSTKAPLATPLPTLLTPSPVATSGGVLIRVLNGGAEEGSAKKFAEALKSNAFPSVQTGNADRYNYKNALVRYRLVDKGRIDKIVNLLKSDYKTVEKTEISTTSAEIVVILGEK